MTDPQITYRETDVSGANRVRLVILLYEQMVHDLARAIKAIEQNDIEARTRAINHAVWVLGHLQGKLNREAGGRVASNLDRFYSRLRVTFVEAQLSVSKELLAQQITDLLSVREAWLEVERADAAKPVPPLAPVHSEGRGAIEPPRADWRS
jgi:flagellar biosynthetic protein FliS